MLRRKWGLITFGVLIAWIPAHLCYAQQYTITDLGTLPGFDSCVAYGVNNLGQVVGQCSRYPPAITQPFLYTDGGMIGLGGSDAWASDVNDWGEVVATQCFPTHRCRAFLYSGGKVTDIGPPDLSSTYAYGINNQSQVVGYLSQTDSSAFAFVYSDGQMTEFDSGVAVKINASGHIAGYAGNFEGAQGPHAFLYDGDQVIDLGTLPGYTNSNAAALNDLDQVVGASGIPDDNYIWHAFLWDAGDIMIDLGTLPGDGYSSANGINANGQIVGESGPNAYRCRIRICRAVIWQDGTIADLNDMIPADSGWRLVFANAINESGQIVGGGFITGSEHAFLLTPVSPPEIGRSPDSGRPVMMKEHVHTQRRDRGQAQRR